MYLRSHIKGRVQSYTPFDSYTHPCMVAWNLNQADIKSMYSASGEFVTSIDWRQQFAVRG